jgi:hypothetical protein
MNGSHAPIIGMSYKLLSIHEANVRGRCLYRVAFPTYYGSVMNAEDMNAEDKG